VDPLLHHLPGKNGAGPAVNSLLGFALADARNRSAEPIDPKKIALRRFAYVTSFLHLVSQLR
jgi:hypothetical protein